MASAYTDVRRGHRALALIVAAVLQLGCGGYMQATGLSADSRKSIEIPLAGTVAEAEARVLRAAVQGGWAVSATTPGVVSVAEYALKQDRNIKITLRANVIPSDSGALVVVSGSALDPFMGGGSQPIAEATMGRNEWKWLEVERFAAAIREGR